jgi:type IV conjugative transfer system protein TraL
MSDMREGKGWWPKYLNAPTQILWWETDEIAPLLASLVIAAAIRNFIPMIVGLIVSVVLIKAKKSLPKRFLFNFTYRLLIHKIPGVPPYLVKTLKQ